MKKINLTKARLTDAPVIQRWWNDGRVMAPVGYPYGLKTTLKEVEAAIESYQRPDADFLLIVTETGEVIGEFCYRQRDKRTFTFDIKIGEYDKQGQGYGRLALEEGIKLVFNSYQPEKIVIEVNASNHNALNLYKSLGFEKIDFIKDGWTNQIQEVCSTVVLELKNKPRSSADEI